MFRQLSEYCSPSLREYFYSMDELMKRSCFDRLSMSEFKMQK
jgi:hypothetical protein